MSTVYGFKNFLSLFILREIARVGQSGAEWGRVREERESQAGSELPVQSLMQGLKLQSREAMTWAESKSQTLNWLSHPAAPDF